MNTRRLAIRLWMIGALLFGSLYVLGVLVTSHGNTYVAIGLTAGLSLALIVLLISGILGLVSYQAHQKEASRGESHDHRP